MIGQFEPSDRSLQSTSTIDSRLFFFTERQSVFFLTPSTSASRSMMGGAEFSGSSGHRAVSFPLASTGQPTCMPLVPDGWAPSVSTCVCPRETKTGISSTSQCPPTETLQKIPTHPLCVWRRRCKAAAQAQVRGGPPREQAVAAPGASRRRRREQRACRAVQAWPVGWRSGAQVGGGERLGRRTGPTGWGADEEAGPSRISSMCGCGRFHGRDAPPCSCSGR
jgi:hypothetical protein